MLFQRINRSDPEKAFIIVKNDESSNAFIKGAPVNFKFDGTDDGLAAERIASGAAAKAYLTAGLADAATPSGSYGLVQVYGVRTDAVILALSSTECAVGDALMIMTASNCLSRTSAGAVNLLKPMFVMGQTLSSVNGDHKTTTGTVFIRAL